MRDSLNPAVSKWKSRASVWPPMQRCGRFYDPTNSRVKGRGYAPVRIGSGVLNNMPSALAETDPHRNHASRLGRRSLEPGLHSDILLRRSDRHRSCSVGLPGLAWLQYSRQRPVFRSQRRQAFHARHLQHARHILVRPEIRLRERGESHSRWHGSCMTARPSRA